MRTSPYVGFQVRSDVPKIAKGEQKGQDEFDWRSLGSGVLYYAHGRSDQGCGGNRRRSSSSSRRSLSFSPRLLPVRPSIRCFVGLGLLPGRLDPQLSASARCRASSGWAALARGWGHGSGKQCRRAPPGVRPRTWLAASAHRPGGCAHTGRPAVEKPLELGLQVVGRTESTGRVPFTFTGIAVRGTTWCAGPPCGGLGRVLDGPPQAPCPPARSDSWSRGWLGTPRTAKKVGGRRAPGCRAGRRPAGCPRRRSLAWRRGPAYMVSIPVDPQSRMWFGLGAWGGPFVVGYSTSFGAVAWPSSPSSDRVLKRAPPQLGPAVHASVARLWDTATRERRSWPRTPAAPPLFAHMLGDGPASAPCRWRSPTGTSARRSAAADAPFPGDVHERLQPTGWFLARQLVDAIDGRPRCTLRRPVQICPRGRPPAPFEASYAPCPHALAYLNLVFSVPVT